jgi:hypothetical protein
VKTEGTGVIPAVMSVLAELDQAQVELQGEFPGWRIWYVYRPGSVSWAARREPVLNTQSPEDLRAAILQVLASDDGDVSKVLEDISAPLASQQGGYDDPEDTRTNIRLPAAAARWDSAVGPGSVPTPEM